MKTWEWMSKRRRLSLDVYLSKTANIDEALQKFRKDEIIPPSTEILENFFGGRILPPPDAKPKPKITKSKPEKLPKTGEQYDDIIVIDTEETTSKN